MIDSFQGTGRRKRSVARVKLALGEGKITVNKRPIEEYFTRQTLQQIVRQPLDATQSLTRFNIDVKVEGGGMSGQAGALRHGIARAGANGRIAARGVAQGRTLDARRSRKRIQEVRPQARPQALPI